MNKKFTKLMAALVLLVFMTPSIAGWGQVSSAAPANGNSYVVAAYVNSKYYALPNGTVGGSTILGVEIALNSVNKVSTSDATGKTWTLVEGTGTNSGQYYITYTSGSDTYYLYKNGTGNTNYNFAVNKTSKNYWSFATNGTGYTVTAVDRGSNNINIQCNSGTFRCYSTATPIILLEIGDTPSVPYTVTLGDDNTTLTESSAGAGVTLPSRPDVSPYTFAGWSETNLTEETTTATVIPAGEYHPTDDITLYPIYSRSESGATTWTKVVSSSVAGHPSGIIEGVYALLTGSDKAFNGVISSGHGQSTTDAFVFTDNVATSAPTGTCEITMIPVMNGDAILGYKMYNADYGYLYASAASSGKLAWHDSEDSYWSYTNYDWCYNSNTAHLRVYNDTFRTYSNSSNTQIKAARKGTVTTTYYISVVSTSLTVTYDANGATSGTVPEDNNEYEENDEVTVLGNTGNLVKTGFTWVGWCLNAEGTGTVYTANSSFTITESTTLYAKWNEKTITNLAYTGTPTTTSYYEGQSFDPTGLTVTATFDDNSTEDVTSLVTWTPDPLTEGTTSVTGTYMGQTVSIDNLMVTSTPGTENNPYTVAQARAAIDAGTGTQGVYATGIVCTASSNLYQNKYLSYYISADGSTESDKLEAYNGLGINGANFTSVDDVQVGDVVVIYGNLTKFNSTYEFAANNQLVSLVRPAQYTLTAAMTNVAEYLVLVGDDEIEFDENNQAQVRAGATVGVSIATMEDCFIFGSLTVNGSSEGVIQEDPNDPYFTFEMPEGNATIDVTSSAATQHTLTVVGLNNVTYTEMHAGIDSEEVILTNNQATLCEGINVDIVGLSANTGLLLQSVTLNDGTTTTTLELEYGVYHFNMPSSNATLTFTTTTAPTYTLANSIETGKSYIIVGMANGKYYAMGMQNNSNRAAEEIIVDNNIATVSSEDVYEFTISSLSTAGFYSIYDARTPGYLYAAASSSNHLKTETELDENHNGEWEITFKSDGSADVIASNSGNRNVMRFNNSSILFSCYTTGQNPVYLYVKDETPATETHILTVTGYADYSAKDGYCLIASPVTVDPADVEGLVVANTDPNYQYFDLYSFANNQDKEWRNYKDTHFDLVPGTGYLYAKKATNEISTYSFELTGTPYSGDGEIELTQGTGNWADWNLVGNPYGVDAEISMDYYEMNGDGSGLMPGVDEVVDAMQGVFVEYTEKDQTVIFVPQRGANPGVGNKLVLNLVRNRGTVIDRAIVRFGEGRQMTKFTLFENSTKLYIPQDDEDYAIVRSEAQGELPVSFRAGENGTYTLSMNVENVEMNYLHLIDNMTGMDVDLLQTPSYTFEANTNDYANRFKLVFAANGANEADESSFAFFSNGNLIVNNEGNATLQVIDINGRILSSETISGSCSKAINATTGVYMLRLINGDNVKVQKVVVR